MDIQEVISQNQDESSQLNMLLSRFRSFAKEHFQDFLRSEIDYLYYIKQSGQFYSFHLPQDKNELFIHYQSAPFYFLCDPPAIIKMEEWIRNEAKGKSSLLEGYRSVKEFFAKWAILKSDQEKKYFALSAIKLIEKDVNRNNMLKNLLQGTIFTFDQQLFNPARALEEFNLASDTILQLKIEQWLKDEFLYVIKIFSGFAYLKQLMFTEAGSQFSDALSYKSQGVSARFYLAYSDIRSGNRETSLMMLNEVIEYDREMIRFAVENNSVSLLLYIIQNANTYNIFRQTEFAGLLDDLHDLLDHQDEEKKFDFVKLEAMLQQLNAPEFKEFHREETLKSLEFIEKLRVSLTGISNTIALFSRPYVLEKIGNVKKLLLHWITQKFNSEIYEQLKSFDQGINENQEAIKHLTRESEETRKSHSAKLEAELQEIDKKMSDAIKIVEEKIENIHLEKQYNPQVAFSNAMVYNIIITLMVFIVGGFSGCYQGSINDVYNFRDVMGTVVISGMQWGAITFLLGTIISTFVSIFAMMDRMNEKQRLLKKITFLKGQKERETEFLKKESEKKLKSITDNFNERIESHQKNSEKLKEEKETRYLELQAEAARRIKEYSDKLEDIPVNG